MPRESRTSSAGAKSITAAELGRYPRGHVRAHGVFGLCLLVLVLASGYANANGRFPRAQRLLEDPRDPGRLVLGATYGLLVTADRGASWRYVCEAAYGERDLSVDALTALSAKARCWPGSIGVSRRRAIPATFGARSAKATVRRADSRSRS